MQLVAGDHKMTEAKETTFYGAELDRIDVARLNQEMARRLAGGEKASRAALIREAIQKNYPAPKEVVDNVGAAAQA
jgi:ABC-type hemin transport system ATPase subunit